MEARDGHAKLSVRFGSVGRFFLCVTDEVAMRRVPTRSGFTGKWELFTEELP